MAYANDPATDRRISRLSLLSSASTLYQHLPPDPQLVLAAAQMWETWIFSGEGQQAAHTNGVTPPVAAVPSLPTWLCAECGNPLSPVTFKKGNSWPVEQLASQSQAKFGKVLCKTHYFGKKTA